MRGMGNVLSDTVLRGIGLSPGRGVGVCQRSLCERTPQGIYLTDALSAVDAAHIDRRRIAGVVVERGTDMSHGVIVARSMGIPVMQLPKARRLLTWGQRVAIDSDVGLVYTNPVESAFAPREVVAPRLVSPLPLEDSTMLHAFAAASTPQQVREAYLRGASGVGLYRTEAKYLHGDALPDEESLVDEYTAALRAMRGKPVFFRTFDLGGDKMPLYLAPRRAESNPMLGQRGIRFALSRRPMFLTQLRALLRAARDAEAYLSFPMIATLEEWLEANACVREAARQLAAQGIPHRGNIPVGLMIETPSAAFLCDVFAREAAFLQVGLNDLSSYVMAVDRTDVAVCDKAKATQPVMLRLLAQIREQAERAHTSVLLMGEAAQEAAWLPLWLGMGFRRFCADAKRISVLLDGAETTSLAECRERLRQALGGLPTAVEGDTIGE